MSKRVGERIHAKGRLLEKEYAKDPCIDEATPPVIPKDASNERGKDESGRNSDREKIFTLPGNNWVGMQVCNIHWTRPNLGFQKEPTHMSIPKPSLD